MTIHYEGDMPDTMEDLKHGIEAETQRANVRVAVGSIAELARENDLVITHGNGPQVGLLALQSEFLGGVPGYPLDILDKEEISVSR